MLSAKLFRFLFPMILVFISCTVAFCAGEQESGDIWVLAQKIPVDKNMAIQQAMFIDDKTGVALSSSEVSLTIDGGRTWVKQNAFSRCFSGIDVMDRNIYIFGSGCSGFFTTTDGGKNISQTKIIEAPTMLSAAGSGDFVVSDKWNIYHTERIDAPIAHCELKAFCAVSASSYFALSKNSTLIFSSDSGKTWTEQQISVSGAKPVFNVQTTCIRFTDANNGMIVYYSAEEKQKGWFVLTTTDNGKTWKQRNITDIIQSTGRPLVSRDASLVTIVPVFGQGDITIIKRGETK